MRPEQEVLPSPNSHEVRSLDAVLAFLHPKIAPTCRSRMENFLDCDNGADKSDERSCREMIFALLLFFHGCLRLACFDGRGWG